MEIKTKKIDSSNAKVEAKVSKQRVQEQENKIAKKIAKDVKIDGFRKGKAPATVIKKLYKDSIEQDSIAQIFQELLKDSIKELGQTEDNLIGEPKVTKYEKNSDGSIDIEFEISFRPQVDTSKVQECIPEVKTPRVTKKEIQERINELLKSASKVKDVEEDRELKEGDIAVIDFEGFVDGKAFDGGKAENYALEIGSGSFIPGFEEALVGMKKGQTKEIDVTFPKEYGSKELAGKDAMFKVTLKKIQERVLPEISDEALLKRFLPDIEHPTKEDFEKSVKKQIKREKLNRLYIEELKPKMTEALIEKINFDLPKSVVGQEIDMRLNSSLQNKSKDEIKELQKDPDKVEKLRKDFEEDAKESVKLTFVVDELAKEHDIRVDDNEVIQAIYYEAMQQGQDPKKYLEFYQKQNLLPAIKMAMIEDKLFAKLLKLEEKEK